MIKNKLLSICCLMGGVATILGMPRTTYALEAVVPSCKKLGGVLDKDHCFWDEERLSIPKTFKITEVEDKCCTSLCLSSIDGAWCDDKSGCALKIQKNVKIPTADNRGYCTEYVHCLYCVPNQYNQNDLEAFNHECETPDTECTTPRYCYEGYYKKDGKCIDCPTEHVATCTTDGFTCVDKYFNDGEKCTLCPANATCTDYEYTCNNGYYGGTGAPTFGCIKCPTAGYTATPVQTTSVAGDNLTINKCFVSKDATFDDPSGSGTFVDVTYHCGN